MFGNTRRIADAIAEGLSPYLATEVVDAGVAPAAPRPDHQ
jgi:flavodoxin